MDFRTPDDELDHCDLGAGDPLLEGVEMPQLHTLWSGGLHASGHGESPNATSNFELFKEWSDLFIGYDFGSKE